MIDIKREVKNKVKQFASKDYLQGYINNEYLTDDGDADIVINLKSKEELFDSRTSSNQLELRKDFYDYVNEKTVILDNNIQINLHIRGLDITEKEAGKAKHIIKEHYAMELYKVQKEYQTHKTKIMGLFLLGLWSLLIYAIIYFFMKSPFFLEVFGFIFSFSLWQAFEKLIYTLNVLKKNREAMAQRLLINVDFN